MNSEKFNKKKATNIQSKSMINLNFNSLKSKVYKLDNMTLKDKYISKYISPTNLTLKPKTAKKSVSKIKKFKNKYIGLYNEELKIIKDMFNNKNLMKLKGYSKIKVKQFKTYKVNQTERIRKENKDKNESYEVYDLSSTKKSFNCYINKLLLKNEDKTTRILNKEKLNSYCRKMRQINEFYNYDCDKIDIYNYNKFDKITYKNVTCNK